MRKLSWPGREGKRYLLVLLLGFACKSMAAEFGLFISASSGSVMVNAPLTYTVRASNIAAFTLNDARLTDTVPSSATITSVTSSAGTPSINGSVVTLQLPLGPGQQMTLTINVQPRVAGTIINTVTAAATGANPATTTIATQVTGPSSDLAAGLAVPSSSIVANDLFAYTVSVTNRGPDAAANVILSNLFSSVVLIRSVSPSNGVTTANGRSITFNVGTLGSGNAATFQVAIQPPTGGPLTLSSIASATGASDTTAANDSVSTNITVITAVQGQLSVTPITEQNYNPQTGLMELTVEVRNDSSSNAPAARVVVQGLIGRDRLYNAVGTNSGSPFVLYNAPLATNQSVNLVLEFFSHTREAIGDLTFTALAVPAVNLTAATSPPPNITLVKFLNDPDRVLIEFPSVIGQSYRILYSDNANFTNALIAQPDIVAPANRVQWIDNGPPKTISAVTNSTRFYRVLGL